MSVFIKINERGDAVPQPYTRPVIYLDVRYIDNVVRKYPITKSDFFIRRLKNLKSAQ